MEIFCGSKTHHAIFPYLSQDQECEQWIQGWIMISGFSPPPPTSYCFVLGLLSDKRLTSSGFVEGLLCGRPFAGRWRGQGCPSRAACPVQFNMVAVKEGLVVQPGKGHWSVWVWNHGLLIYPGSWTNWILTPAEFPKRGCLFCSSPTKLDWRRLVLYLSDTCPGETCWPD